MIDDVERRLKDGQTVGCHLELMVQNAQEWELDKESLIGIAGGLLTAGVSTSATLLHSVVFFAAAFPKHQRKFHEELDQVVGANRSPILEDTKYLPSLNAFISEVRSINAKKI
ncbi:hypothetical protein FRC02_003205 [Tulasnella sp. 418]|nr:hypothetical protein FRC02_003205 [Tulasnella sp. 418]